MRSHPDFPNLHILDHPLITHKLTHMRNKETPTVQFRLLLKEISLLMGYEITRDMPMTTRAIETPLTRIDGPVIHPKHFAIVSILRAGLGMVEGLHELIPTAPEGHVGLYRDPATKRPVEYYVKLPDPDGRVFLLVDPMLATGYSAVAAVDVLNKNGVADTDIRFMALVAAPEGMAVFQEHHAHVPVYTAALDSHLNEHAYIVPGLGDAGDRVFGTK